MVSQLLTNNLTDPLGVNGETPRLSWQLNASRRGVSQQRYEVHVASTAAGVGDPDVWNSGIVPSARSVAVPYAGPALAPYKRYFWTVRVWDDTGQASAWSPVATFETGPLRPADWQGDWIGADTSIGKALPLFRKDITVTKKVVSARIHAAAQGIYELRLNGVKVGDQALAPGWTDYNKRIQSQSYNVMALLKSGANTLGAELSSGWFSGNVAMFGANKYGSATALVAQLRITYGDGTTEVVATDNSWRTTPGAAQSADLLNGESYDARRAAELTGWDRPGYDASAWSAVVVRSDATAKLVPQPTNLSGSPSSSTPGRSPRRPLAPIYTTWTRTWWESPG